MRRCVLSHPAGLEHKTPLGYPERPARLRAVLDALDEIEDLEIEIAAELPPEDDILGVVHWLHSRDYVDRFREHVEQAPTILDNDDCPVAAGTFDAALAGAGLALKAALEMANGRLQRAFIATRPPGHHAEGDKAMGFCYFNNIAIAAEVLARAWQQPVLIVDFDVHHGNGTQKMFWESADVGFLSVHRYPFYPGTGSADEIGEGPGRGTIRNLPLSDGADDQLYASALEIGLEEMVGRLRPAAILISAGFDAHRNDPLGGMKVSESGFARMTKALVQAADSTAQGRILSFLEGGYDLGSLASSARRHVRELLT